MNKNRPKSSVGGLLRVNYKNPHQVTYFPSKDLNKYSFLFSKVLANNTSEKGDNSLKLDTITNPSLHITRTLFPSQRLSREKIKYVKYYDYQMDIAASFRSKNTKLQQFLMGSKNCVYNNDLLSEQRKRLRRARSPTRIDMSFLRESLGKHTSKIDVTQNTLKKQDVNCTYRCVSNIKLTRRPKYMKRQYQNNHRRLLTIHNEGLHESHAEDHLYNFVGTWRKHKRSQTACSNICKRENAISNDNKGKEIILDYADGTQQMENAKVEPVHQDIKSSSKRIVILQKKASNIYQ